MRRPAITFVFAGLAACFAAFGLQVIMASEARGHILESRTVRYCDGRHRPKGCIPVPKSARRPASLSERRGPVLMPKEDADGGGLGAGPDEGRAGALQWSQTQLGSTIWAYRCERFVEEAYGTRNIYASAWEAAKHIGLHREPIERAPVGSLVYFGPDAANRGFGHVGLSLGGGRMLSALEAVGVTDVKQNRYWSSLYRGWAYPPASWPGRIPPPPTPSGPLVPSSVEITAPAVASTVSGTVTLEAAASDVSGIAFEAYYATEPANSQTIGWHLLGDATLQDGAWGFEWNTLSVPEQGNPQLGTVNIAAIALTSNGALTGTRDYRRVAIDNQGAALVPKEPVKTEPQPEPQTWAETTGSIVNTWSNYSNAGGTQGPSIPAHATVQVSCRVEGFRVEDGNTWWYRLASSPWSNGYYASADAFYNDGETSGSLIGTPFVDPSVAEC
jgi:NlpC/P60 family